MGFLKDFHVLGVGLGNPVIMQNHILVLYLLMKGNRRNFHIE